VYESFLIPFWNFPSFFSRSSVDSSDSSLQDQGWLFARFGFTLWAWLCLLNSRALDVRYFAVPLVAGSLRSAFALCSADRDLPWVSHQDRNQRLCPNFRVQGMGNRPQMLFRIQAGRSAFLLDALLQQIQMHPSRRQ
jgi:hypothetical protein